MARWFRELKDRTKRFHNKVNTKKIKSLEELVSAIALKHNSMPHSNRGYVGGIIAG
ncbi:MAG: hypothetical protein QXW58_06645 [Thermosphaera sp.]